MHFHLTTRSLTITDIKVYLGEDHANNDNGGGGNGQIQAFTSPLQHKP